MLGRMLSFLILGLMGAAVSQAAVSCGVPGGNVEEFGKCNFGALGGMGASDPEQACAGNVGDAYHACMCTAATSVIRW